MGAAQFYQRNREGGGDPAGHDAEHESQDSETLRARIATEMRSVERLQRLARPVALVVFTLLALLVILQLYTWARLEQLTALSQQLDERERADRAVLQEAIEKPRGSLSQSAPPASARSSSRVNVREKGSGDHETVAPAPAPAKVSKPKKVSQPEARSELSPAKSPPAPESPPAPVAKPTPARGLSLTGQTSTTVYENTQPNRPDAAANRQENSAAAGPALAARTGAEAGPNEGADPAGVRPGPADTVIARDHNDIERLRKLGKRDYVEFTLVRSDRRRQVAPDISLQLRKVDSKRLRCALNVYAEDYEFPTDLGINEPIVFPIRAMWESVELVINKVGKDSVGGYLTARKGVLGAR